MSALQNKHFLPNDSNPKLTCLSILFIDSTSKLCLKDVSDQVTKEFTSRLQNDPAAQERFYRSFGLHPGKLRIRGLSDIKELFPDTPVKMLKEVCEALQLFDLVELLDKETKPKTLRPALPLKEIEKLPSANYRPTKIYTKAEVLIIRCSGKEGEDYGSEKFGHFFKLLNTQNKVTELAAKSSWNLNEQLDKLKHSERSNNYDILRGKGRERRLKMCLQKKLPFSLHGQEPEWVVNEVSGETFSQPESEELSRLFYEQEAGMKKELREATKEIDLSTKEGLSITEEIKEREEDLKKETEKFKITVLTKMDNWIEQSHDKGI